MQHMKGEIFHILNRGVEKRKIFFAEKDRFRFAYNLQDFNNTKEALPYPRRCQLREREGRTVGHRTSYNMGEKLVTLLCWSFLPNHVHNLVQEKIDGGASVFSKKIFGGYTKYINELYDRSGVLFQGGSKIIRVTKDPHFDYLPFYIMANPIELIEPGWREGGIKSPEKVMDFLENYRWSSLPDLIGKENFPGIVNKDLFYELFGTNEKKFKDDFIGWLKGYERGTGLPGFID